MVIKNIVFDLGKVLLSFDHQEIFAAFERCGGRFEIKRFFHEYDVDGYERGEIDGEEFLRRIQPAFPPTVALEVIRSGWQDIFSPIEEMIELAKRLRTGYRTYILSNTCDLHWDNVEKNFRISSLVHGTVTSFEARARKPELAIYRFAERKFALRPEETVFIDDIAENTAGAIDAGWRGIHHVEPKRTMDELRTLGVSW